MDTLKRTISIFACLFSKLINEIFETFGNDMAPSSKLWQWSVKQYCGWVFLGVDPDSSTRRSDLMSQSLPSPPLKAMTIIGKHSGWTKYTNGSSRGSSYHLAILLRRILTWRGPCMCGVIGSLAVKHNVSVVVANCKCHALKNQTLLFS
jgi:hypothetical protein